LNRRTAPKLYLEVQVLGHVSDSRVGFPADGPTMDWLVVMRRFEQRLLFDPARPRSRFKWLN
jgi:aminoglycoside phosphotransferase family enzyme